MNDLLQQKVVEILTQFQEGVSSTLTAAGKAAPHVVEYAIRVKFYDGLGSIVGGFIALFFLILILGIMYRHRAAIIDSFEYCDAPHVSAGAVFFGLGAVILIFPAFGLLLDTWNWVAVFDPKIALAHDLFEKVMAGFGH